MQCVIENLGEEDIDENDDSSDEEEEEKEEDDDDDDKFPSLEKIISKLENFYSIKEDQKSTSQRTSGQWGFKKWKDQWKDFNVRHRS